MIKECVALSAHQSTTNMMESLKDEFRWSNVGWQHEEPFLFAQSQWPYLRPGAFLCWRVFWAVFHTAWMVRSVQLHLVLEEGRDDAKWLIYLTNWSYALLTLQSLVHLAVVVYHVRSGHQQPWEFGGELRWFHKVYWVLTSTSFSAAVLVAVLFWVLVFEELEYAVTLMTHAANALYAVTDTMVIATPCRLLHVIYPFTFAVVYVLFSVIYHVLKGTNTEKQPYIYESLDWSQPESTAVLALGILLVAVPLTHVLMFGLTQLRTRLARLHTSS